MSDTPDIEVEVDEDITLEDLGELSKVDEMYLEELAKKCPRCGGPSANKSNPSGRCKACLGKLKTAKKTPGHWQRAQTKADDALRRQKGKNGTAHKKSSGLGSRKSIVKQTESAEKRTGEKLSPDRKNNGKGYAASNTRMVPEKLNRGRHHVDPKKLRAWQKRVKKSEVNDEFLYTAVLAKAEQENNTEALTLLRDLGEQGFVDYIKVFDIDDSEYMEKTLKQSGILPHDDVAFIDVNDTLLHKTSEKEDSSVMVKDVSDKCDGWHTPNKRNIELVKELKEKGHPIVVWSGSGYKMAKAAVELLDLQPYVDAVMAKPSIYVDNKPSPKFLKNRMWRDPEDPKKDLK